MKVVWPVNNTKPKKKYYSIWWITARSLSDKSSTFVGDGFDSLEESLQLDSESVNYKRLCVIEVDENYFKDKDNQ